MADVGGTSGPPRLNRSAFRIRFAATGMASGHMPGAAVMKKNSYAAAAQFVMSKTEPEREAKKVGKAIADEIGKFMSAHGIPTLRSTNAGDRAPAPER